MTHPVHKVFVADSHYLIRYGLQTVLSQLPNIQVVGEASDEEELLIGLSETPADIVIIDYYEDGFSLATIKKLKQLQPNLKLIIISTDEDRSNIFQALEDGISAFLTKSCGKSEIQDALKATLTDGKYFCSKVLDYLVERSLGKDTPLKNNTKQLTPREIEIVQLVAKGLIAKEIAALLHLSTHTIYTHRKKIMKKLELKSSSELVMYAVNHGLISI